MLCLSVQGPSRAVETDACIRLLEVDIEAGDFLPRAARQSLAEPFLGACIDSALTRELLTAISDYLIADGYVTSRPYLVEQDIADGQLEIRVLAGRIEAIVDADSGEADRRIAAAFAFSGEILNLRELETALETLQRVSSVEAAIEIRPGQTAGGSVVAIERRETAPLRLEVGANAQSDLDDRLSLLAQLDNPLDLNDVLQLRLNDGELREALQSNRSREISYSLGFGAYHVDASYSEIDYRQRLQGINGSFLSAGEAATSMLGFGATLARGQAGRLSLNLSLEVEDTDNFLEDVRIEVSSYRTSQLRAGLRLDWYLSGGQWINELTYHRGLDAFGARDDDFFDDSGGEDSTARLQFEKFVLDSQWRYYLAVPDWYVDGRLHLQYSDDILFAADKLTLGSPLTVRGYASALSGGNGGYLRADITRQWQSVGTAAAAGRNAKTIALSFGIDYGEIKCEIDNPDVCGDIYGAGIGLLVRDANFSAQLQWARPLKRIDEDIGDEDRFLLDLRWAI